MKKRAGNAALSGLKSKLRAMPISLAHKVASRVAPTLTGKAQGAYDGARTVYGEARPKGVNGNTLDLVDSGRTRSGASFSADGRIVRASLPTKWAKYLIGKYRVLPNGPLPIDWKRSIDGVVHT